MNTRNALCLLFCFVLASCVKDNNAPATLAVRLTDSPGDYQEVNIDIQDVQVNTQDGNAASGWTSLSINKGVYNLLSLTDGLDTLLGSTQLPAGKISQIRLVLGNNNTIKIADVLLPLTTPSAQESGLKVQIDTELKEGITYTVLLDFDAAKSIVSTGSNKYILKPVIRSVVNALNGAISGIVSPAISKPAIYTLAGTDTVATTFADSVSGKFLFKGIAAGTYTISFAPRSGYQPTSRENVSVTVGNTTDLGTILISQ